MATTAPSVRRPTAAVGALVGGGILVVVGTLLPWFGLTASGDSDSVAGTDMSVGLGVLFFGVLLAVAGLVVWIRSARGLGRGWSIAAIVFGAFAGIIAMWSAFAPESALPSFAASDVSEQLGISETQAEGIVKAAIAQGLLGVSAKIGAFASSVGALLGIIGGILGVRSIRKPRPAMAQAAAVPPPPPLP